MSVGPARRVLAPGRTFVLRSRPVTSRSVPTHLGGEGTIQAQDRFSTSARILTNSDFALLADVENITIIPTLP
ncbi:hypothetical protein Sar04_02070 [Salinispora arenicola]|uniref:Uncharacterized protein n=1 Tax=Salinispora arenicola TaxID=168697 RepID=A0A542XUV2_SALAC|nr:hypothetical protein FB564_4887 [Salinispora arenicola]GIM81419.1 hypothetical protein Sar04_02070 [Salinispora arenicola]